MNTLLASVLILGIIILSFGVINRLFFNCDTTKAISLIAMATGTICLVFFVVASTFIRNNEIISQEIEERAIVTMATVIAYEPVISILGRTIGFRLVAEQEIDGIRYVFRSGRFNSGNPVHDFPAGSTVPVLFDPIDSSNNRIDKELTISEGVE